MKFQMLPAERPAPPLITSALVEKHHAVDRDGNRLSDELRMRKVEVA
jgi:hypothetical protein